MKLGTLCYIEKDGETLLLHRNKKKNDIHAGKWIGLGGKIEPGESPQECVVREVYEESGLMIKNPTLRGVLSFPGFDDDEWHVFLYTVNEFVGEIIESNEGTLKWVKNNEVSDYETYDSDRLFLKWLDETNMFEACFKYENNKMIDYSVVKY